MSFLCTMQGDGGSRLQIMPFEPKNIPICVDTGVLDGISNDEAHFISLNPVQQMTINGIRNGFEVKGIGTARCLVQDDLGNEVKLSIKTTLFILDIPTCPLFPQQIAQQTGKHGDRFQALAKHGILTFNGFMSMINYHHCKYLLIVFMACSQETFLLKLKWMAPQWTTCHTLIAHC